MSMDEVICLAPLTAEDMPELAAYRNCPVEELQLMLEESLAQNHDGCYYEQFTMRADGRLVGVMSLYARADGVVSEGVEVFEPFRRNGFAAQGLSLLMDVARKRGYSVMTAQVRVDNTASIALHEKLGFQRGEKWCNRRGREVYTFCKPLQGSSMHHEMSLRPGPFEKIANGSKRYELRLMDEKRRLVRVGDIISFACTEDERTVQVRVTSLHPFADFAQLYAALPLTECGYTEESAAHASPKDMEQYYPPEKQREYGVLAIGVERIRLPIASLTGAYMVRALTAADIPEMLRVARSNPLFYRYMRPDPDESNLAADLVALPPRRTLADKHFFGWFEGERLVAMMDLISHHPKPDMAFVGWFILDGAYQGQGLGRRLIADVLAMLKCEGVTEVRLGRIQGNPQSEHFWHAVGFEENGRHYDTELYRVIVMAKRL